MKRPAVTIFVCATRPTTLAGCGLDQLPVLGEVTFDRATQRYFNLKQTDFDRETGTLTPVEGAPKLADFVGPALAKRLIPNLGFTTCQIGWKLGQVGEGRLISLESEEGQYIWSTPPRMTSSP